MGWHINLSSEHLLFSEFLCYLSKIKYFFTFVYIHYIFFLHSFISIILHEYIIDIEMFIYQNWMKKYMWENKCLYIELSHCWKKKIPTWLKNSNNIYKLSTLLASWLAYCWQWQSNAPTTLVDQHENVAYWPCMFSYYITTFFIWFFLFSS